MCRVPRCVAVFAALIALCAQPRAQSSAVIYEGARVIIGDQSAPIENGAFVVQNGRISAIGRRETVTAPPGATRVDLSGKTVMPAIVNAHAHFGYEKFTKAEGESRAENFTAANLLDHMQREAFYGVGTVNDGGSAAVPIALEFQRAQAAHGFPLAAQFHFNAGIVPPEGGPDSILIKGTRPLHANYEVLRAPEGRAPVKEKTPYWATVIALGDRSEVCENDPFFTQSLSPAIIADIQAKRCGPVANAAARDELLRNNFMVMINAGARLVLGTDAGVRPGAAFGSSDHHEIAHWVEMGLTPKQAIIASTSRPAEALGLRDVGTLAEGTSADFIVLDANPLDDIRNTRQIASVYLRGVKLDREALLAKWKKRSHPQEAAYSRRWAADSRR